MLNLKLPRILAGAALAACLLGASARAQEYPTQPVRIIVPSSAGGGLDLLARTLSGKLSEKWNQPVLVENNAGAGGVIGTAEVAQAPRDGYTLLVVTTGFVTSPTLNSNLPYNPLEDFTPITVIGNAPLVLVTHPSAPFKDAASFIAHAKANPGTASYGSAGVGSGGHLSMELFQQITGTKLNHIPYQGAGNSKAGAVSGEVMATFSGVPSIKQNVLDGSLVALGINSKNRSPELPDVPTFQELGYSDFVVDAWFGIFGPADMPPAVTQEIYSTIDEIMSDPETAEQFRSLGFAVELPIISPDQFSEKVVKDLELWREVITAAGINGVQ